MTETQPPESIVFGQYTISASEVFLWTPLCFAIVNVKPLAPGHVMVCPRRKTERYAELTEAEVADLWVTSQTDGPEAGQTVKHVHAHIIPRHKGDFWDNDDVYRRLEDDKRPRRSAEEMAAEAATLRALFAA